MKSKPKWYSLLFLGLVLLLASSVVSCSLKIDLSPSSSENPRYVYVNGAIQVGGDGEPIELINNPNAINPTYDELVAFIVADSTNTNEYLEGGLRDYVCADFAEDVHNNAEAAGIKAAWVGIDFEGNDEGHALNAFETVDRGLVYVDCTGGNPMIQIIRPYGHAPPPKPTLWDKVAYVEIGKEYGLIDIAGAKSLLYGFYEEYKQKWQLYETLLTDYNEEVARYNQEIKGKVYYEGSPELAEIEAWEARLEKKSQELDELAEELGDYYYEALGVVTDIDIHW